MMSLIYTYHYTDRSLADIYKYFDDAKYMYGAVWTSPIDFLSMLTGIGNDTPHFNLYYDQMNNWFREYESNLYNDNPTLIRWIFQRTYRFYVVLLFGRIHGNFQNVYILFKRKNNWTYHSSISYSFGDILEFRRTKRRTSISWIRVIDIQHSPVIDKRIQYQKIINLVTCITANDSS